MAYNCDNLPSTRAWKHTLQISRVNIGQSRISRLCFMIKCVWDLFDGCVSHLVLHVCVRVCVGGCGRVWVWTSAPLASSPPGHHMQSWEPRLAPSVGLMPSLSPKQLAPTSLIILAGTMEEDTTTHTYTQSGHTYEVRDRHT